MRARFFFLPTRKLKLSISLFAVCLNDTVLDGRAKEVMKRARFLKACISNHNNGTELNFTLCSDCKNDYDELTNYYNRQKINSEFCMDVIDLVSSERSAVALLNAVVQSRCCRSTVHKPNGVRCGNAMCPITSPNGCCWSFLLPYY